LADIVDGGTDNRLTVDYSGSSTSRQASAIALETFDEPLIKKTGMVGNPDLIIRRPHPPAQKELFDG
jgi:hypothetical protein